MALCYICNGKLYGERARVCSSITPHSNSPFPEKIAELLGEEFLIVVTPQDHLCKRCATLMVHMDKLENDLKLVKHAMVSYIQKKYGLLPADQTVRTLDIVNGNLKTDEVDITKRKVPSGSAMRNHSVNPPPRTNSHEDKQKIYKCGFCSFQSRDLGHVRFHMRSHVNKKDTERVNQTVAKTSTRNQPTYTKNTLPTLPQKRLYRCQVCSLSFDTRVSCLEHIQNHQNSLQTSHTTAVNEGKKPKVETALEMTKIFKPSKMNSVVNQHAQSNMDADKSQQAQSINMDVAQFNMDITQSQRGNNGAVASGLLFDNNVPAQETTYGAQEGIQNTVQEVSAQRQSMQVDQNIQMHAINIKNEGIQSSEGIQLDGVENQNDDHLDIESMLAAIHNDSVDGAHTPMMM